MTGASGCPTARVWRPRFTETPLLLSCLVKRLPLRAYESLLLPVDAFYKVWRISHRSNASLGPHSPEASGPLDPNLRSSTVLGPLVLVEPVPHPRRHLGAEVSFAPGAMIGYEGPSTNRPIRPSNHS